MQDVVGSLHAAMVEKLVQVSAHKISFTICLVSPGELIRCGWVLHAAIAEKLVQVSAHKISFTICLVSLGELIHGIARIGTS